MKSFRTLVLATIALACAAPVAAQSLTEDALANLSYREIGPTRQSGRFVDIAVPSDDPHTFYIATASGHLWKTTNRGISFEVLFADQPDVFSIGAIAVAPSDADVLYLGSGEANNSRSSYWGNGVYKSTDAGATWTNVGLPESQHIGRIVVHPTDPDVVYVAALGPLYSEGGERGLYRSTDGGRSWERVLHHQSEGRDIGVVDVVMDPTDPNTLYAATYDKVRLPFTFDLGGPGSRLFKTTDGGENWIQIGQGLPEGMLGRIGVDVYHRDPNILYVTIENANKDGMSEEERRRELLEHGSSRGMIGGEVYRSDDAGLNWRKVSPDDESVGGGPAYYYGQIIIDPNDPDVVYVLSARSWVTRNGGETWERPEWYSQPTGGFGGDDHALWIDPDDSRHMILGYDHGMGVSYDGGARWYHPDFQSLAQFYAVGVDNSYPYRVAGGLQDNGSHMAYHTNPSGDPLYFEMWERVGGGDGMYNEFDWCENRYLYNESQFGPIRRTDLLTGESKMIRYEDDELRWNWNAPILVSPHDCDVVYHAANRLLRSEYRGESWDVISPDLTKADPATLTTGKGGDGNIQYATITTIDESPLRAGFLWVGTDDGNVQLSQDGGASWTLLNDNIPNNPEYWVSRVEASHHDLGTAYVTYTGYRRDDFRPFVYKTTDFGRTWTDISANLPDGPVNVIREHHRNPDLLFVGHRVPGVGVEHGRRELDEHEARHADESGARHEDPGAGQRPGRRHARPRHLHRGPRSARGAHAGRARAGGAPLPAGAGDPLDRRRPHQLRLLQLRGRERGGGRVDLLLARCGRRGVPDRLSGRRAGARDRRRRHGRPPRGAVGSGEVDRTERGGAGAPPRAAARGATAGRRLRTWRPERGAARTVRDQRRRSGQLPRGAHGRRNGARADAGGAPGRVVAGASLGSRLTDPERGPEDPS